MANIAGQPICIQSDLPYFEDEYWTIRYNIECTENRSKLIKDAFSERIEGFSFDTTVPFTYRLETCLINFNHVWDTTWCMESDIITNPGMVEYLFKKPKQNILNQGQMAGGRIYFETVVADEFASYQSRWHRPVAVDTFTIDIISYKEPELPNIQNFVWIIVVTINAS
eukprot:GHVL01034662.1.p1 GENE.GHVL01034662.1~~GHVL01034662.1.p1  ORF type:complete len:168 (+),score=30.36 GHVL01034662.1:498-1001(+)